MFGLWNISPTPGDALNPPFSTTGCEQQKNRSPLAVARVGVKIQSQTEARGVASKRIGRALCYGKFFTFKVGSEPAHYGNNLTSRSLCQPEHNNADKKERRTYSKPALQQGETIRKEDTALIQLACSLVKQKSKMGCRRFFYQSQPAKSLRGS